MGGGSPTDSRPPPRSPSYWTLFGLGRAIKTVGVSGEEQGDGHVCAPRHFGQPDLQGCVGRARPTGLQHAPGEPGWTPDRDAYPRRDRR